MYRLLSLRKIKMHQLNNMTLHNKEIQFNVIERTCTLCKQTSIIPATSIRCQSTNTSPNMKPPRKKRLRGVKKYAELLVVTDTSTTEQKAKVRKLTSADLNFLTLTNLNLSELYKLKEMRINRTFEEHTYNNLTIMDLPIITETIIPHIQIPLQSVNIPKASAQNATSSVIEGDPVDKEFLELELNECHTKRSIIEELEPFQAVIPATNAFQPEVLDEEAPDAASAEAEDAKDPKGNEKNKFELLARQEVISRTLAAYIEICNVLNTTHKAWNALTAYKHRCKYSTVSPPITDLSVYNAALKALAATGDLTKLLEVINYAKSVGVDFNLQSYVSIFECLGRCNVQNNHLKEIRIYAKEAKQDGFNFDNIISEGIFLENEKKFVLKAMEAYDKDYIPKYTLRNIQYNNELLNHLNNKNQLRYQKRSSAESTGIFNKEKMNAMIEEQMAIEKEGYITIRNIENKEEPTPDILKYRKCFEEHLKNWEVVAAKAFDRDLVGVVAKKQTSRVEPFLRSIPIKDFTKIIIDEAKLIAQGSETYSPTVNQLYRELGNKVYNRFKVLRKKHTGVLDKVMKIHTKYCDDYVASHKKLGVLPDNFENLNSRQVWQFTEFNERPFGSSMELDHQAWVPGILQTIGKFLYNIIMHDLKIDANTMKFNNKNKNYVPAFYTIFRHHGRIIKEELKPHPILSRLYRASAVETLSFPTNQVPMKCPPIPWSSLNTGGYLVTQTDFVRLPAQAVTQRQRLQEAPLEQLYPSFDALNQLAAVPWKVNRRILDCIVEVFSNGGSAKLSVPEHPGSLPHPEPPSGEMDKQQRSLFFRQKLQFRRKKAEMYSLWCDCLYRLSLANHFKDDVFWLPHNMDFRGRVYPIPPHLNHLGSDLARSMLVFAEGRPLGPKGLDWLKIHLVNLTGLKKRDSIDQRLKFANEIMPKILDSADRPLTGEMWWVESDEPWQTLACCMEIATATRSDTERYVSHFPVHQDGSCNGLQHYAALGRDSAGGHSVNLTSASKPQDVYSAVAALVEERRQKDADSGLEIAKILNGFVRRKVIKQTVMTTVYGVTRYGARLQIARQLKDIDDFPKEAVWAGSSYLTSRTFESLRSMFTSTREIQDWFTDCARLISSVCGGNVEWVTPLGLPIVQPYFRYKTHKSSGFYEHFNMDKYEKPNVMKQKNAFPPNFIHSLDSSHMMLTSLHCEKAGITFVSVHDCYWTHPSTVHIMNKICREQFVALHSEPILENLSLFLAGKYSYNTEDFNRDGSVGDAAKRKLNKALRRLPKTGNFNIEEVLDSVYFFS